MVQNRRFVLVFRLIALALAGAGVLAQIGVFAGNFSLDFFMYYTIQSNMFAIILFAMLIVATFKGNAARYPRLSFICAISLLVTFIVYWALLAPLSNFNLWTFENITTHGITPLLVLADFILFNGPGQLKYRDIYYCTIFPLAYVAFTYFAVLLGYSYYIGDGNYAAFPYFFLDFHRLGFGVIAYIIGLGAFFILLAHAIYFIDHKRRMRS
jgi:hypothetical protein